MKRTRITLAAAPQTFAPELVSRLQRGVPAVSPSKPSDVSICVPETKTFKVHEFRLPIYHAPCLAMESHRLGEER